MSDFDLYIFKNYLFIPLLVLFIPIQWGPALQCMMLSIGWLKNHFKSSMIAKHQLAQKPIWLRYHLKGIMFAKHQLAKKPLKKQGYSNS
jgi:hypothetical protein